jgi:hypothetical protein
MRFCFVTIVKREHLLLPNFDPIKNQEKKIEKIKSKIQDNIHKESLEDCPSWW